MSPETTSGLRIAGARYPASQICNSRQIPVPLENPERFEPTRIILLSEFSPSMLTSLLALLITLRSILRSRLDLQFEILALRHQIGVLQRSAKKRPRLTATDRLLWVSLSRIWRHWRSTLVLVKPETVVAWHRKGFRLFWTWKVRHGQPGRPTITREIRDLIRRMCRENPTWGAPRIHGELLKLGIDIGESSVTKYMVRSRKPPSQNWRTFLENHLSQIVSVDFFTVPTLRFQVLYVFLVLAHDRRRIVHCNVTAHPTAEWTGQQLRDGFPFDQLPRYLLRDRDAIFGNEFRQQLADMEIHEVLSAPRSPWQRAYVERVIGSIRRECLDHVIVFNQLATPCSSFIFRLLSQIPNPSLVGQRFA